MNLRKTLAAVSVSALTLTAGCETLNNTFFSSPDSLSQVDELLSRIERVHVESELCKERIRVVNETLHTILSPDFSGQPVAAHAEFMDTIERSEEQADALRDAVGPMKATADAVFQKWATDLESFSNPEMRHKSMARLEQTRDRYKAIVAAVEPAQWSFDAFNRDMRDLGLFLGNDFNPAAVREITGSAKTLSSQATELDSRFDACLMAAQNYLNAANMHGAAAARPPE